MTLYEIERPLLLSNGWPIFFIKAYCPNLSSLSSLKHVINSVTSTADLQFGLEMAAQAFKT